MNYISLYRKYRPNTFDKIVGQIEIKKALKSAIIKNSFSHAYLFSGPRGTGKTSIAKIFAKAINCQNLLAGNPCNNCPSCNEINRGASIDVFEIDAASNNGVDEIREIRNNVQLLPTMSKYKIYIIDEIHMLTNSAFNALLKTLEEPPQHVVFILATTESHKIPATIISRCQQYNFRKINKIQLEENLINVLGQEKIDYELAAIKEIAILADGSARDSLSILEQIIMFSESKVILQNVNLIFATVSKEIRLTLLKNILEAKTDEVLQISKKIYQSGTDFEILVLNLLDIFKEVFEYKQTKNKIFLNILEEEQAHVFASTLKIDELIKLIDLFADGLVKMKTTRNQEMYFELILLKALIFFEGEAKKEIKLEFKNFIPIVEKETDEFVKAEFREIENNEELIFDNYIKEGVNFKVENNEEPIWHKSENYENPILTTNEFFTMDSFFEEEKKVDVEEEIQDLTKIANEFKPIPLNEIDGVTNFDKYRDDIKNKNNIYNFLNVNYSMNQVLNILVKANKEHRENYEHVFGELISEKGKLIRLDKLISFYGAKYVAGSEQGVVIVLETKPEANWISHDMCDWEFRNKLFQRFDFDFVVIPLSETEWTNIRDDYAKIRQANKLPQYKLIDVEEFYQNILVKQIPDFEEHKNIIATGKEIFDNIKIIE